MSSTCFSKIALVSPEIKDISPYLNTRLNPSFKHPLSGKSGLVCITEWERVWNHLDCSKWSFEKSTDTSWETNDWVIVIVLSNTTDWIPCHSCPESLQIVFGRNLALYNLHGSAHICLGFAMAPQFLHILSGSDKTICHYDADSEALRFIILRGNKYIWTLKIMIDSSHSLYFSHELIWDFSNVYFLFFTISVKQNRAYKKHRRIIGNKMKKKNRSSDLKLDAKLK